MKGLRKFFQKCFKPQPIKPVYSPSPIHIRSNSKDLSKSLISEEISIRNVEKGIDLPIEVQHVLELKKSFEKLRQKIFEKDNTIEELKKINTRKQFQKDLKKIHQKLLSHKQENELSTITTKKVKNKNNIKTKRGYLRVIEKMTDELMNEIQLLKKSENQLKNQLQYITSSSPTSSTIHLSTTTTDQPSSPREKNFEIILEERNISNKSESESSLSLSLGCQTDIILSDFSKKYIKQEEFIKEQKNFEKQKKFYDLIINEQQIDFSNEINKLKKLLNFQKEKKIHVMMKQKEEEEENEACQGGNMIVVDMLYQIKEKEITEKNKIMKLQQEALEMNINERMIEKSKMKKIHNEKDIIIQKFENDINKKNHELEIILNDKNDMIEKYNILKIDHENEHHLLKKEIETTIENHVEYIVKIKADHLNEIEKLYEKEKILNETHIIAISQKNLDIEKGKNEKDKEISEYQSKVNKLKDEIDEINNKFEIDKLNLIVKQEELNKIIEKKTLKVNKIKKRCEKKLKVLKDKQKSELDRFQNKFLKDIEELEKKNEGELKVEKEKITELQSKYDKLNEDLEKEKKESKEKQEREVKTLKDKLSIIEKDIEDNNAVKRKLKRSENLLADERKKIELFKNDLVGVESQITTKETEFRKLNINNRELERTIERQKNEIQAIKKINGDSLKLLRDAGATIFQNQTEQFQMKDHLKKSEDKMNELNNYIVKLEQVSKEKEQEVVKKESEIVKELIVGGKINTPKLIQFMEDKNIDLEKKVRIKDEKISSMIETISDLNEEIIKFKDQIEEIKNGPIAPDTTDVNINVPTDKEIEEELEDESDIPLPPGVEEDDGDIPPPPGEEDDCGPPPPPGMDDDGPPPPPGMDGPPGLPPGLFGSLKKIDSMDIIRKKMSNVLDSKQLDTEKLRIGKLPKNMIADSIFAKGKLLTQGKNFFSKDFSVNIQKHFRVEQKVDKKKKGGSKEKKKKKFYLVDSKKTMLSTLVVRKFEDKDLVFETFKNADVSLPEDDFDKFQALIKSFNKEKDTVLQYQESELSKLEDSDRYVYEIYKIPFLDERVRFYEFKYGMEYIIDDLKKDLNLFVLCSKILKNCEEFKEFLSLILVISNYMNVESGGKELNIDKNKDKKKPKSRKRSLSISINVRSLNALAKLKSKLTKNTTLLDIVYNTLSEREQLKRMLTFIDKLSVITKVKDLRIDQKEEMFEHFENDINFLDKTLESVVKKEEKSKEPNETNVKFIKALNETIPFVKDECKSIRKLFKKASKYMEKIAVMYGQQDEQMDEFYLDLAEFLETFQKTRDRVEKQKKKEKAREARRKKKFKSLNDKEKKELKSEKEIVSSLPKRMKKEGVNNLHKQYLTLGKKMTRSEVVESFSHSKEMEHIFKDYKRKAQKIRTNSKRKLLKGGKPRQRSSFKETTPGKNLEGKSLEVDDSKKSKKVDKSFPSIGGFKDSPTLSSFSMAKLKKKDLDFHIKDHQLKFYALAKRIDPETNEESDLQVHVFDELLYIPKPKKKDKLIKKDLNVKIIEIKEFSVEKERITICFIDRFRDLKLLLRFKEKKDSTTFEELIKSMNKELK